MTKQEREIARQLRQHVEKIEPIKARGTLEEYITVYNARQTDNWAEVFKTRLYEKFGFEYCILLEVLAGCR